MSDFVEELWSSFAVEFEEHIASMRPLLEKALTGLDQEDIVTLYRDMHSINNLSRAMEMHGIEEIAHQSEILIGAVRHGKASLGPDLVNLLKESMEVLDQMRHVAVSSRLDSHPPESLANRLIEAVMRISQAPEITEGEGKEKRGAMLHDDPKMMEFFASRVKKNIPIMTSLVDPGYKGTAKQRAVMTGAMESLRLASEGMGFVNIVDIINRAEPLIPEKGAPSEDAIDKLVSLFVQFKLIIDNVEREARVDAGGGDFSSSLEVISKEKLKGLFDNMIESLGAIENKNGDKGQGELESLGEEVSVLARSAYGYLRFGKPASSGSTMLFLEDIFHRVARNELSANCELVSLSLSAAKFEKELIDETDPTNVKALDDEIKRVIDRCREVIDSGQCSNLDVKDEALIKELLSKVYIRPEMMEVIAPENMADLLDALEKGWKVYEITTYLESDEEMAEAFMDWALNKAKVITNRSLIKGRESWFQFLVVSKSPAEVVLKEIKAMNPAGDLLKAYECKPGSGS